MNAINSLIMTTLFLYGSTAFAESNTVATSGTYIDWLETIVLILGLLFLGWYQKYQIGILKRELESQKNIISSLKQYSDILDVKKIKEFVALSEETIRKKTEIERMALESNLTAKIKSAEAEKENLLSEVSKYSEMTDKIKSEYEAVVERSSQRAILFYKYTDVTQTLQMLSLIQERLLMYAKALLLSNKIVTDRFDNCFSETSKLSAVLYGTLKYFGKLNLLELKEDLKIPDVLSGFDKQKCVADLNRLGESLSLEINQISADLR